mmetsp:Transcript_419/g.423  ORF Transcript_419/g.423 Transcript_419/m.423 type:complete len:182 (-) Transcript_419:12-557(-)
METAKKSLQNLLCLDAKYRDLIMLKKVNKAVNRVSTDDQLKKIAKNVNFQSFNASYDHKERIMSSDDEEGIDHDQELNQFKEHDDDENDHLEGMVDKEYEQSLDQENGDDIHNSHYKEQIYSDQFDEKQSDDNSHEKILNYSDLKKEEDEHENSQIAKRPQPKKKFDTYEDESDIEEEFNS